MKKFILSILISVMTLSINTSAFAALSSRNGVDLAKKRAQEEKQEEERILTYEKALNLALENNSSIKSLEDNLELMRDNKSRSIDSMGGMIGLSTSISAQYNEAISSIFGAVKQIDISLRDSKYSKEILEKSTEMLVKSNFISIIQNENTIALAEKNLELAQKELNNNTIKYNMGMISKNDYESLKTSVESRKSEIATLKVNKETNYNNLNKLLGYSADKRYEIEYNIDLDPIDITEQTLDTYINQKLDSDPSIKVAFGNVEYARYVKSVPGAAGSTNLERETNLTTAERSYKDTCRNMELSIRNAYSQIDALQKSMVTTSLAIEDAKRVLESAKINYDIGNIPLIDLQKAEMAVDNAENSLLNLQYNYDMLKFTFEYPFLLSSGS